MPKAAGPSPDVLMQRLHALVKWPGPRPPAGVEVTDRRVAEGFVFEEILLNESIPGTLVKPDDSAVHPAVLYCHAHGGHYERGRSELTAGAPSLHAPWGQALAAEGFAVLCIDMPAFGARQAEGPEGALAKAHLWRGRSLFGAMLDDLTLALDALAARPDVDENRLWTLGLSMGATHAFWLAAIDERIRGVVQLCVMADMGPLIETGAHDRHNHYLTVPGFLNLAEVGDVAGLVAPRPQFIAHGTDDHLTPPAARDAALARVEHAYKDHEGALVTYLEEGSGHLETAAMRNAALQFLREHALKPSSEGTAP